MSLIERTCDRCASFAADCTVEDEAYICGDCRAEIAEEEAGVEALHQQLEGAVEALEEVYRLLGGHRHITWEPNYPEVDQAMRVAKAAITTAGRQ